MCLLLWTVILSSKCLIQELLELKVWRLEHLVSSLPAFHFFLQIVYWDDFDALGLLDVELLRWDHWVEHQLVPARVTTVRNQQGPLIWAFSDSIQMIPWLAYYAFIISGKVKALIPVKSINIDGLTNHLLPISQVRIPPTILLLSLIAINAHFSLQPVDRWQLLPSLRQIIGTVGLYGGYVVLFVDASLGL